MRIVTIIVLSLCLSGCMILSDDEVQSLKNSATILEGGVKSDGRTAELIRQASGDDSKVAKILDQVATRQGKVAGAIRNIVGKDDSEGSENGN